MAKTGKKAKDIFAPTAGSATAEKPQRGPGRPPVHNEAYTKATVVLFNRQIVFLDRVANEIRAKSGTAVNRAEIIRALIDALEDAKIDLTGATSEADLKDILSDALAK